MLQRDPRRRIRKMEIVRNTLLSIERGDEKTYYTIPDIPIAEAERIIAVANERYAASGEALNESEYLFVRRLLNNDDLTLSDEHQGLWKVSKRRALWRRVVARIGFALLLGLSVPILATVIDISIRPDTDATFLISQGIGILLLLFLVSIIGIGTLTFLAHRGEQRRWHFVGLPILLGVVVGLLLVFLTLFGIAPGSNYLSAFLAGGLAGIGLGFLYTISLPAQRQDTVLKQSRQSLLTGALIGVAYGVYFLMTSFDSTMSFYSLAASLFFVPLTIVSILLSFVLGIEFGDRYIEQ